jgi:hypothetical protein
VKDEGDFAVEPGSTMFCGCGWGTRHISIDLSRGSSIQVSRPKEMRGVPLSLASDPNHETPLEDYDGW